MEYIAGAVMTTKLVSINDNSEVRIAHKVMDSRGIDHLPVVNSNYELVGIVSRKDIFQTFQVDVKVVDIMTKPVFTVHKNESLLSVIELMIGHKIGSVLVEDRNEVVGIITGEDLMNTLMKITNDIDRLEEAREEGILPFKDWVNLID